MPRRRPGRAADYRLNFSSAIKRSQAMNGYQDIAVLAARAAANGVSPVEAWKAAAARVYAGSSATGEAKSCPMYTFLGLAESGQIVGIQPGKYGKPRTGSNKRYAAHALRLIRKDSTFAKRPRDLWRQIQLIEGRSIRYNEQMDVVAGLWHAMLITPS